LPTKYTKISQMKSTIFSQISLRVRFAAVFLLALMSSAASALPFAESGLEARLPTYETLARSATASAFLAQLNAQGARGFAYAGDFVFAGTEFRSIYVKDLARPAVLTYETPDAALSSAAFLTQANARGARGFRFLGSQIVGSDPIFSIYVNDGSGGNFSYELLGTSSAVANFIAQANTQGARGFAYLGSYAFSVPSQEFATVYVKNASRPAIISYDSLPRQATVQSFIAQHNRQGNRSYVYRGDLIFGLDGIALYERSSARPYRFAFEFLPPTPTATAFVTQSNAQGARGFNYASDYAFGDPLNATISSIFIAVRAPSVSDLSGDGNADLLVQLGSGGTTSALFMNGTSIAGIGTLEGGGGGWSISHTGDFDGDGKADLFWRNSNGASTIWLMNGSTITAARGLLPPGSGWTVTHLGDFNGDGKADLLWRNDTDGSVTVWLMDGTNTLSAVGLLGGGSGWRVNHVGDLNGDGKADLMWRNDTDGSVTTWLMNGTSVTSAVGLLGGGSGWRVSHLADFNGDGKADLLWRNDIDGSVTVWLMDGASITSAVGLLGGSSWRVGPVGDLDGDGKADLIWRNDGLGITTVWLMNGTTVAASAGLLGDAAWRVVQLRDTNGDGKADLVWRNESGATTGSLVVWTMNGLTITGAAGITGPGFDVVTE
jgi:hypothetical protein